MADIKPHHRWLDGAKMALPCPKRTEETTPRKALLRLIKGSDLVMEESGKPDNGA